MLDQFRSLSGSLPAKILLVFLVLSFGAWGIGDMLRHPGSNRAVATVGSATISTDEFAHALYRENENIRRMLGDRYSPELVKSLHLPPQVLQKMINRTLLALESQSLGLVPDDAEVVRHIRSNPAFQDEKGAFDKARFEGTLRNAGMSEKNYVDQLRQDMGAGLLMGTLDSAVPVSDVAVRAIYNAREEQRSITLYTLAPGQVTGVPQPSEAQITDYYNAHKDEFTAPEYRTVSYVAITSADVKNAAVSQDVLKAAYKDRIEEFKRPERRTIEQLLYNSEDKAKAAEALLKSGKNVNDVAKTTDILNKDAVSLGKVERGAILQNAADSVFALPSGGFTDPIQSPFGWHIFHVSAIDAPSTAPFEEVRPQLEKDLKQHTADEGLNALANKLEDALAGGASLAEAAKDLDLKMHTAGPINHQGTSPDGSKTKDVPDYDKFLQTAFKTDDKTDSSLMTSKGGVYYLLHVDGLTPERLRAQDEVRGLVAADWQKEERWKRLAQLAKDVSTPFASSATRVSAIAKFNLQAATTATIRRESQTAGSIKFPPDLVAEAFTRKPQEGTAAYPSQDGNYVLAVVASIIAAPAPDAKNPKLADIRNSLTETAHNELLEEYARYLAEKYSVSINEAALDAATK